MTNVVITGVGGQGTVLASRLLAAASLNKDIFTRTAETLGMAQRGGSVVSHLRLDAKKLTSLVPEGKADLLIAFEPGEAVRAINFLRAGGTAVINSRILAPTGAMGSKNGYPEAKINEFLQANIENLIIFDATEIALECGSAKSVNVVLLGAVIATGILPFNLEDMEQAIRENIKPKLVEMNILALHAGHERASFAR